MMPKILALTEMWVLLLYIKLRFPFTEKGDRMNNEEIAQAIAVYEEKMKVANHRIDDLEEQQKQIQDLTLSVQELAMSVKNMVEVQKAHSEKISELESKPAQNWNTMQRTVLTAIVSAIAGAAVIAFVNAIVPFM